MLDKFYLLGGIIFYIFLVLLTVISFIAFIYLYVFSFGAEKEDENYIDLDFKIFCFCFCLLATFFLIQLLPSVSENIDVLRNGFPDTIEINGHTYQHEEYKPPETIEKYGETYVLVTE